MGLFLRAAAGQPGARYQPPEWLEGSAIPAVGISACRFGRAGAGDTIDLLGIGLASAISVAGQVLTVTPAVGASFALNFAGVHNPALFAIAPDGLGGTLLTYA